MRNSIARKLVALIALALLVFGGVMIAVIDNTNKKSAESDAANLLGIFETQMHDGNYKTVEDYQVLVKYSENAKNIRVSVIDMNGNVLADTLSDSPENFENHLSRPEIIDAANGNLGLNMRKSETFNEKYLYAARTVTLDETMVFLRVSIPAHSINGYLVPIFVAMGIVFVVIIILVLVFSKTLSSQMITPISLINKKLQTVGVKNSDSPITLTKYDEVNEIISQIESLSNSLDAALQGKEEEKEKLNFILENINQGVIAVDKKQNVIMMNQMATELFNFDMALPTNIMNVERNQTISTALDKAITKGQYQPFDVQFMDNRLFELKVLPVEYEDIRAVITISEVTDIRKLQIEKQEFFQNASHELNTPLTSILGYSEVLIKEKKYNENFLVTINKEASRMKLLISDMLKIAELEGEQEIIDEIIELDRIAADVASSFEIPATAKNITIERNFAKGKIKANPEKIREIISNLLDNAIKYTESGGKIMLSLHKSKGEIIFTIKDTGIGIPRQYTTRVFERFFRVDKSRSKVAGGTGLGLSIVKHICNYYNASISIRSNVGVGTEISIAFQLV